MKKFRYKYQKLMETKGHQEKKEVEELAKVKRLRAEKETEVSELNTCWDASRQEILTGQDKALTATELVSHLRHLQSLSDNLFERETELAELEEQVELERQRLLGLRKERKIFEKLKERQWDHYRQESDRTGQASLDEIASRSRANPAPIPKQLTTLK